MQISKERMKKSLELYKDVLCEQCLKSFNDLMKPFENLGYKWKEIDDLKTRHKVKLTVKIGVWQRSLCQECMGKMLLRAKEKDDIAQLKDLSNKMYNKGKR